MEILELINYLTNMCWSCPSHIMLKNTCLCMGPYVSTTKKTWVRLGIEFKNLGMNEWFLGCNTKIHPSWFHHSIVNFGICH
jgi:hypothetical protein